MLKLESPFHLIESSHEVYFRSGLQQCPRKASEIILEGLSISIEAGRKTYDVVSDGPPEHDGTGSFRGTTWARWSWPLIDGVSIEQQMVLPAGGDAVAISWRLIGRALFRARLKVSPIFLVPKPMSGVGFEIEPETHGGRLAWRPYGHSSKIIADTNGRCAGGSTSPGSDLAGSIDSPVQSGLIPAIFDFDLGSHPAILVFSAEPQPPADADPLIGGFLAQLAQQRTAMTEYDHRRDLVAA